MSDWRTELREVIAPAVAGSQAVKEVLMAPGAISETGALLKRHLAADKAFVVTDRNCQQVAGERLQAALDAAGLAAQTLVADEHWPLSASVEAAKQLCAEVARHDAVLVALGSGTINDLAKYAALHLKRDFCAVATAASMDGYAAAVAPLSKQGFKTARPGRAPAAVVVDLDIVRRAPAPMAGWGYGDMAGKIPAGGDWLLADALGVEPLAPASFALVQDNLPRWLAGPERLARGDRDAFGLLCSGLLVVGLAMERYVNSRPASGAEHNIAHCWEMEGLSHQGKKVAHGACVAVGTMAMLSLYDWLGQQDLTALDTRRIVASAPSLDEHCRRIEQSFAIPEVVAQAKQQTARKHPTAAQLRERVALLKSAWPELRGKLRASMLGSSEVARRLATAGAPAAPEDIGVSRTEYLRTVLRSRYLRDRYTILDMLAELGLLEQAVREAL